MLKLILLSLFSISLFNPLFAGRFKHQNFYKLESLWTSSTGEVFKLCRISSNGALKIVKEKKIKVYFKEDSDKVSRKYKKQLKKFMNNLPKTTFNIKMNAHADTCGNKEYNAKLSLRRGNNVYFYIKDLIPKNMPISGKYHGEEESSDHSNHDKYVEVIAEYWITNEKFSQVVLFDVSGSLHQRKIGRTYTGLTLQDLKRINLPRGTIAYVPRDPRYKCQGQKLGSYKPIGEDFYHEAMTLISTSIIGSAVGTVYTDDTDPKRKEKEKMRRTLGVKIKTK